jgi:hypothetical protein
MEVLSMTDCGGVAVLRITSTVAVEAKEVCQ